MSRLKREWFVLLALAALLGVLALCAPRFFQAGQILFVLTNSAPTLLVATGIALVMIARQIDISVGSQFACCGVIAALLAAHGWPMAAVAPAAVLAGAALGALNGVLVAGLGLPSIVVTLATMICWREALRWWREGEFVSDLPPGFQWFGLGQRWGEAAVLVIAGLVFLLFAWGCRRLAGGRYVYAVGSDAEAARLAGIDPRWVTFAVFTLLGGLTGLAALLGAVRFADVDPKSGQGLEMQTIAAAVVGGVAVTGGRGSLWGVFCAVLLLGCIAPALVFLRIQPQWERALQGMVILVAVAADGALHRKRRARP